MGKKLSQFQGRLTLEQIAEGMNAASRNAIRLVEDAQVLLAAERYPSALALAILAIEEAGKLYILPGMVTVKDDQQLAKLWKDCRSHTKKNVAWILLDLINRAGTTKLDDLRRLFDSDAEHPYMLDKLKQIAFYTDCLGIAHWSIPTDAVERDLAGSIITIAKALCLSKTEPVTRRELQLWKQHMSPRADGLVNHSGLSEWYAAMQAEGLRPPGPNAMQTFLTTGMNVWQNEGR
ncbi:AbiV family abortive infection protein [Paraburkholderia silviterrae]|uniref:AbiV family abortive infection protein n=1 Tax=Paraburkholderia silviterrae TaxID=2528715 RepID=A0A4R5MG11_9BURK|nr:AbiV family abortive infection protein [Paraburkholderia silviterrae]TDG26223.1 AbiV family abortive infection protein [Paraburkholderia silviterrae]